MTREFSPAINAPYITGTLKGWPLEEFAALGYRGLEVTPECLSNSSWLPQARGAGLRTICVNALPELTPYLTGSLTDAVDWRRRETIDGLLKNLKWMQKEEVPFLVVAPSRLAENYQSEEGARRLLVQSLTELAKAGNTTVLLEQAPFRLFATSQDVSSIIDDVDLPNVGAALDIGHAMLCGEMPSASADILGARLKYLHIRDVDLCPGHRRLDQHLPMGEGSIRAENVADAIRGRPWSLSVTAPASPLAAARSALKWMDLERGQSL